MFKSSYFVQLRNRYICITFRNMDSNDALCSYLADFFGDSGHSFSTTTNELSLNETGFQVTWSNGVNESDNVNNTGYSSSYNPRNEYREIQYYLIHFVMPGFCLFGIVGNLFNIIVVSFRI